MLPCGDRWRAHPLLPALLPAEVALAHAAGSKIAASGQISEVVKVAPKAPFISLRRVGGHAGRELAARKVPGRARAGAAAGRVRQPAHLQRGRLRHHGSRAPARRLLVRVSTTSRPPLPGLLGRAACTRKLAGLRCISTFTFGQGSGAGGQRHAGGGVHGAGAAAAGVVAQLQPLPRARRAHRAARPVPTAAVRQGCVTASCCPARFPATRQARAAFLLCAPWSSGSSTSEQWSDGPHFRR